MAINVMDTMVTSARHEVVTATAVMTACEWMRRWNALTSWRPVNAARQVSRITASVVTRMPPAVEVLPPPMNMTMDRNTFVASLTPGIHGRNRLMGNSLLDVIVFGRNAGQHAAKKAKSVSVGTLTLDHVAAFEAEKQQAGVADHRLSPQLLPDYARKIHPAEK